MILLTKENKTISSAIWYTISNLLSKAFIVLLTPIFARLLTTSEYGEYTNFLAWQNVLVIIMSLELSSTVMRAKFDYSKEAFSEYLFSVSLFSILFPALIGMFLFICCRDLLCNLLDMDYFLVLALIIIISFYSMLQIFQAEQRVDLKYKISSFTTILFSILSFAIPISFCTIMNNKLHGIIGGSALCYFLFGFLFLIYYTINSKIKKIQIADIKYALSIALPLLPHLISNVIMGNSDKVMITKMCGLEYSAMYGIVYTSALVITLLRNSLNNAWVPWLYQQMTEKNYYRIKKVSNWYIIVFSFFTLFICFFGPEMVLILGGKKYLEAAEMIPPIMLGCFYNYMNLFYVNIEFYQKKTFMISVITIITALLNIVLNYFGIKYWDYQAAAVTTAFCNSLTVIFHYFVTKNMNNSMLCNNKMIAFTCIFAGIASVLLIGLYRISQFIRYSIFFVILVIVVLLCYKNKEKIEKAVYDKV